MYKNGLLGSFERLWAVVVHTECPSTNSSSLKFVRAPVGVKLVTMKRPEQSQTVCFPQLAGFLFVGVLNQRPTIWGLFVGVLVIRALSGVFI